jgi:hypothetical protein
MKSEQQPNFDDKRILELSQSPIRLNSTAAAAVATKIGESTA